MMKIIDVSRVIAPTSVVYPGDDPLVLDSICEIGSDAPCRITSLSGLTTHVLSHVDAPAHFIAGGKTLDDIPVGRFVVPARVIAVQGDVVSVGDIPDNEVAGVALLFKTRNSEREESEPFDEQHVYVARDAAQVMVDRGVVFVGIDYLSVDKFGDEEYPVHNTLLGNEVLIAEGLRLQGVAEGEYHFSALPLRIRGGDGSPVRACLIDITSA